MSDERIRILQLVQDGKITPAEALALMEALAGDRNMITELVDQAAGPEPKKAPGSKGSQQSTQAQNQEQPASWEVNLQKSVNSALKQVERASEKVRERAPQLTEQFAEQLTEQMGKLGDKLSELSRRQSASGSGIFGIYGNWVEVVDTYDGVFNADTVTITVDNHNGGVTVQAWDQPGYKVIATKRVAALEKAEAEQLAQGAVQVETSDDALTLKAKTDNQIKVTLDLFLPHGKRYHLVADSTNGGVKAEHLQCSVCRIGTTNGSIKIAHLTADQVALDTTNGPVVGEQVQSTQTAVETTNGGINWTGAGQITNLETTNGAIKVKCTEPAHESTVGRYSLQTTNGGVIVNLSQAAAQAEVHFQAATSFGRILVPADSHIVQRSDVIGAQRLVAELPGDAQHRLEFEVKTSHGAVQLTR